MEFYAHTLNDKDGNPLSKEHWEPLFTPFGEGEDECKKYPQCELCESMNPKHGHLNKVAWWTAKFAEDMFPEGSDEAALAAEWGYLTGLWHDLGKFSKEFQKKLMGESISVEHSGAGAAFSKLFFSKSKNKNTHHYPLAAAIAGHHSGLSNFRDQGLGKSTPLLQRLKNNEAVNLGWSVEEQSQLANTLVPNFHDWCRIDPGCRESNLSLPFYSRQLISCLVDADSLVTEALDEESKETREYQYENLKELQIGFDLKLEELSSNAVDPKTKKINSCRKIILTECQNAAEQDSGVFSLNVPTGGGKTLSGMSFALRHAVHNKQNRIIVVAPYTTIIEQTADEYRKFLGEKNVIEHHSNLDDFTDSESVNEKTKRKQLAAENWDAPIIVTTTVQFFESLFANKRSRCRKLHNIANSVVIIDEAQCLPSTMLDPTLFALNELIEHYHCTLVLSTATQPAFHYRAKFPKGFKIIIPILPEELTYKLHQELTRKRINISWNLDKSLDYKQASEFFSKSPALQKLIVVNSRKEASQIFETLKSRGSFGKLFHLSTNLCPVHRKQKLKEIKELLKPENPVSEIKPCSVVSTQLIECGVDQSYQCVIRSMAGLDSLAQSAGRCNRNGENSSGGEFIVYESENKPFGFIANCAAMTRIVLGNEPPEHLADLDLYKQYFIGLYQAGAGRDTANVLQAYQERNLEDVAQRYKLIDDYKAYTVVIPWLEEGRGRLKTVQAILQSGQSLGRKYLRALQPYSISLSRNDFEIVKPYAEPLLEGGFSFFIHPSSLSQIYCEDLGLKLKSSKQPYLGCHE